ncbi:MAG: hypothetical protein JSV85_00720 [Candidatus Bathyarchaeota archaeon]|nr:MAG: hypothetical protein JSV85_00720 [Candidatus Bathyarchaeota archaeon]
MGSSEESSEEQEGEINYRDLFILGLVFLIVGIGGIFTIGSFSILLLAVGIVLLVISLANRDKWTKSSKET